jgi:hypothetical protein
MSGKKIQWILFTLYMAIFGSYVGLELDTFIGDLPFFRTHTLIVFLNLLVIPLLPVAIFAFRPPEKSTHHRRTTRMVNLFIAGATSIFFHFAVFLALYKSVRKTDFDFYFFWYNIADTIPAMWILFAPWFPVALLSIVLFGYFQKHACAPVTLRCRKSPFTAGLILSGLLIAGVVSQIATLHSLRGSAAGFIYASFISDRQLRNDYRDLYDHHISLLREDSPEITDRFDPAAFGEVVIAVKMESLNGFLTGHAITPQLMRAAKDGVLFPEFYSNAIQSLRGYECILCGVPPGAERALVDNYPADELSTMPCLPRTFSDLGYQSIYFFGGSRNPRIVRFAESIGFDRVLADEIMHPEDTKYPWGYREDIFYLRAFDYLQEHYRDEKLFVFFDTGATNHTPFEVLDDSLLDTIPYPRPSNFMERISNTTFVQDEYFGRLYDMYRKYYAHRGSLIAVSDHSWPISIHEDNIYNERGAWEENFMISLLFVPPDPAASNYDLGATVELRFSQMDIYPTVLDLLGLRLEHLLGESFAPWLLRIPAGERPETIGDKLSIQPYGGGFISVVRYPEKYLFDILGGTVEIYDLEQDPLEQSPSVRPFDEYLPMIHAFFHRDIKS